MCLYGVATELRRGDERKLRGALRFFTPLLWEEGLERPLVDALRRVRDLAAQQLEELERFSRVPKGAPWLN